MMLQEIFILLSFIGLSLPSQTASIASTIKELDYPQCQCGQNNGEKGYDLPENADIDSLVVTMSDCGMVYNEDYFSDIDAIRVEDLSHSEKKNVFRDNKYKQNVFLKVQLRHGGKENIINAINVLNRKKEVKCAEPNYKGKVFSTMPNDANDNDDWYIPKIELNKAWDISTGSSQVEVGVIDTGIDGTHRDLTNRIDESLSVSYSPNPGTALDPGFYHGTWVAGIIGAQGDNSYDTSGVNWNTRLISLRVDGPAAGVPATTEHPALDGYEEDMCSVISAINYATEKSIPIINFSGGFVYNSSALYTAIQNYPGLFICASGNYSRNIEDSGNAVYPAIYNLPNMITVGASTSSDTKAYFSDYGPNFVHLFAPGVNIRGSNKGGGVRIESGTSGSAPIVAGVAALIKSVNSSLSTSQIKKAILSNVDVISNLNGYCSTGGRLNAFKAVKSVIPSYQSIGQTTYSPIFIPQDAYQWFKFDAQNAAYHFEGISGSTTSGYLYSGVFSLLSFSNSGGYGSNFALNYTSDSLQTLFIKIINNGSALQNIGLKITLQHNHSYDDHYQWLSLRQHRAFCSCGQFIKQGHAIISGGHTCLICGGKADMGLIQLGETSLMACSSLEAPYSTPSRYFGNGSYVLSNGVIVLSKSDIEPFLNGELSV